MSTTDALALAAAVVACVGAVVVLAAAVVLVGQVRRLERGIEQLREEALEALRQTRAAAGAASSELARVDAVLADTEAVTATVDHAARLAERAFANPVVKVLAWRAGARGALWRLAQPAAAAGSEPLDRPSKVSGHRRRSRRRRTGAEAPAPGTLAAQEASRW